MEMYNTEIVSLERTIVAIMDIESVVDIENKPYPYIIALAFPHSGAFQHLCVRYPFPWHEVPEKAKKTINFQLKLMGLQNFADGTVTNFFLKDQVDKTIVVPRHALEECWGMVRNFIKAECQRLGVEVSKAVVLHKGWNEGTILRETLGYNSFNLEWLGCPKLELLPSRILTNSEVCGTFHLSREPVRTSKGLAHCPVQECFSFLWFFEGLTKALVHPTPEESITSLSDANSITIYNSADGPSDASESEHEDILSGRALMRDFARMFEKVFQAFSS